MNIATKTLYNLTAENAAKDAEIESLKKRLASLQQIYNHNITLKGAGTFRSDSFF